MPVVVSAGSGGGPSVPAGQYQAVCSRVWDLGMQEGYGGKLQHKIAIMWELDARIEDGEHKGKRHVFTRTYTASLDERANLRGLLESWRGKAFTADELAGFDLEKLVGANCMLNLIEYQKNDGGISTKLASIAPATGQHKMEAENGPEFVPQFIADMMNKSPGISGDNEFKDDLIDDEAVPF